MGDHDAARQAGAAAVEVLEAAGDDRELTFALEISGSALLYFGDAPSARQALGRGEALARARNDPLSLAFVLSGLIQLSVITDHDLEAARAYAEEELHLGQQSGDRSLIAEAMFGLGVIALAGSDWSAARHHLGEASRLFEEIGDRTFANSAYSYLADVARSTGELPEAEAQYQRVIAVWHEIGHRPGIARCLECLAFIAGAQGRVERAANLFGAAEALRENLATDMVPYEKVEYGRELAALRGQLGDQLAAFEAAWQAGRRMNYEEAVTLALTEPDTSGMGQN